MRTNQCTNHPNIVPFSMTLKAMNVWKFTKSSNNLKLFPSFILLIYLVRRELVTRFRRHYLGFIWILISPILTSLIMILAFYGIFGVKLNSLFNYSIFVLSGVIFIQCVNSTIIGVSASLQNSRSIIGKVSVPIFAIPLATLFAQVMIFVIGLVYILFAANFSEFYDLDLISLFVSIICLFLILLSIGIILSVLGSIIPDIATALPIFLQGLTYVTPIFYTEDIWSEQVRNLLVFNPLLYFIRAFRNGLGYSEYGEVNLPLLFMMSSLMLISSTLIFIIYWPKLIKRI